MIGAAFTLAVAGFMSGLSAGTGGTLLALLAGLFFLVAAILAGLLLRSRRRLVQDVREVVLSLESIRAGEVPLDPDVERGSALTLVADAVNRLGNDVGPRLKGLDETSERLTAVMDAVKDSAVIGTDVDGDIRSFSAGATELFGWDETDVVSRPAAVLFEEEAYRSFLPKLTRRSLREKGISTRSQLVRRDGAGFPAEISVRVLRDAEREPVGFLMVVRDVSEHVELERVLRESEQRYRGLVEGLADGVLIVREGRVLYANLGFEAMTGEPVEHVVGRPLRERVATPDVLTVQELLQSVEGRPGSTREMRCRFTGAEKRSVLTVVLVATAIEHAGAPAVLVHVRDETEQGRAEYELRRNESQLDAVLEATSDGILVLVRGAEAGRDSLVRMTNRAFLDTFDLRAHEVLGASASRLRQLLEERGHGAESVAGILDAPAGRRARHTVSLDGEVRRELEISIAPLTDRQGNDLGCVLACRDLSEQHEARQKLQQHAEQLQLSKVMLEHAYRRLETVNRDLRSRTEQLDGLNQELRTLDEMKSHLLGNASHELQTPLVSIRGYTEMIAKGRLGTVNEEQRKGLGLCLKNIDRLIGMIDNLLDFSRSEPGMGRLSLAHFSLSKLVDEATQLLNEKIQKKAIRFTSEVERDLRVHADRDKILQVLINLLSNAIKFNRSGGAITLTARRSGSDFVNVEVADEGIGIPADAVERVFDRNFQVSRPGTEPTAGSGIGLAIVRDILRLHGCRISVESEEGHGSRFHLTLPLSREVEATEPVAGFSPSEPQAQPVSEEAPSRAPERVDETERQHGPAEERKDDTDEGEWDWPELFDEPAPLSEPLSEPLSDPVSEHPPDEEEPADPASDSRDDDDPSEPRPRFRIIRRDPR